MDQAGYDVRCEWGLRGVDALRGCRTFVIVDVLSFSTCVATLVERGAVAVPFGKDEVGARELATREGWLIAGPRGSPYSLSPATLLSVPAGARVVLPSLNGSMVSAHAAGRGHVLAGCLRNRRAIAARARALGGPFAIIAAGEQWPDGSLRPALEDLLGVGAIAAAVPGTRSPEVEAAVAGFEAAKHELQHALRSCSSGRELAERGYLGDVDFAAELDVCTAAPELLAGVFTTAEGST
jgi:2-phosphosulfolactate phosphatase